ncbi:MAG: hypothetical protein HQL63_13535 [Magnetococcales bacterium]|nr:hypothetical protein [Magnetococcales bacterium]
MNGYPILEVIFFRTGSGVEPVREWLRALGIEDRKAVGEDIKLVQFRWPLGMPWVRKMELELTRKRKSQYFGELHDEHA